LSGIQSDFWLIYTCALAVAVWVGFH